MNYATTCNRCNGTGLRTDRNEVGPCEPMRGTMAPAVPFCYSGQKIRKNGTCSEHACYWCDGNVKLSPREAFLQEIGSRVNGLDAERSRLDFTEEQSAAGWRELCAWIADNGPSVSRAERWQDACKWFDAHRTDVSPRWAVTQGTVWLYHANGR